MRKNKLSEHINDLDRARQLGISVEEFQSLVGHDPLETYSEFIKGGVVGPKDTREYDDDTVKPKDKQKNKKGKALEETEHVDATMSVRDAFTDIGDGTLIPFETDNDVNNKTAEELENYWDRPITSPEDEALYYGFHIHGKDNVFGLHAHLPGGPLGGGHLHGPQNTLGYHTHRYNQQQLLEFKFARPGIMIQLDAPHTHQNNAPDGKHIHSEENFGPASDRRADKIAERNARTDHKSVD